MSASVVNNILISSHYSLVLFNNNQITTAYNLICESRFFFSLSRILFSPNEKSIVLKSVMVRNEEKKNDKNDTCSQNHLIILFNLAKKRFSLEIGKF